MKLDKTVVTLALTALAATLSLPAHAQATIDQNKATTKGIGGGDSSGYPITITQPGSYKLMGNLVVPAGAAGIVISVPGVTLDLNGFTIAGPMTCSAPGVCSMAPGNTNVLSGIVSTSPNTVIRNGTITGFQGSGVQIVDASVLEDLMVSQNGVNGVSGGVQAQGTVVVSRVRATLNKQRGIALLSATVDHCVASSNGTSGFQLIYSSLSDSVASNNLSFGVGGASYILRGVRSEFNVGGNFSGGYISAGGNTSDYALF